MVIFKVFLRIRKKHLEFCLFIKVFEDLFLVLRKLRGIVGIESYLLIILLLDKCLRILNTTYYIHTHRSACLGLEMDTYMSNTLEVHK